MFAGVDRVLLELLLVENLRFGSDKLVRLSTFGCSTKTRSVLQLSKLLQCDQFGLGGKLDSTVSTNVLERTLFPRLTMRIPWFEPGNDGLHFLFKRLVWNLFCFSQLTKGEDGVFGGGQSPI